nr:energy-coupling factor transporter transmembrane component T [uncultured Treponema sp.]
MRNLDPRTHLAVMLCATVVWFFYEQIGQIHCLCLLAGCYLLQVKEVRTAERLCFFYTILQVLARICAPHTALLYVILHTFARSIPLVMFAAAIVKSNPSRLMASWQSLHIPKSVTIMLCMMMRFFPVLQKEMASIRQGIRARGLFPHWYDYLRRPVTVYESFFVPFTVRCLKLSAELGATAELRGLDAPTERSSLYAAPLSVYDYLTAGLYAAAMLCILFID